MRIDPGEFRARPLRVHALLHDVPLEDVWAVPLSGGGAGRTIEDLRAVMVAGRETAPAVVNPTRTVWARRIAPGPWSLQGHQMETFASSIGLRTSS